MPANDYHFITQWKVKGTCEEVYEILRKPEDLARWWPEVYLKVDVLEPGGEEGVGMVVDLLTKGKLPYKLKWSFCVTNANRPYGFGLEAKGDFVGTGQWTFTQEDDQVSILYDWKIRADKPLLRSLSGVLKPVFSANHRWAMEKGEAALKRELVRRASSLGS
jgi:hypothetical protein